MVIGLLILTAIPVVTGVAEGVSSQKEKNAQTLARLREEEARMQKFYVDVRCSAGGVSGKAVDGGRLVVRDGKVWIASQREIREGRGGRLVQAFFLDYPDEEREVLLRGLVSQVEDDPPLLNWIFVDRATGEVRYGNRSQSRENIVGMWDWAREDEEDEDEEVEENGGKVKKKEEAEEPGRGKPRVTFEGWEGFIAVSTPITPASKSSSGREKREALWQLYFDTADDGLKGRVQKGRKKVEVELRRAMVDSVDDALDVRAKVATVKGMSGGVNVVGGNVARNNVVQTNR